MKRVAEISSTTVRSFFLKQVQVLPLLCISDDALTQMYFVSKSLAATPCAAMPRSVVTALAPVTGGFLGSCLVMKLLQGGYTVRDPTDATQTNRLLELPGAAERLSVWKAVLAEEGSFAVKGCTGVFHVATPMDLESKDPENDVIKLKPTVEGMTACKDAGTVRRFVFTSSAGTVTIEERQTPVYDQGNWSDVNICHRVKMTGRMYFVSKSLAATPCAAMPRSVVTALAPVTGGFLGSCLVMKLLQGGYTVRDPSDTVDLLGLNHVPRAFLRAGEPNTLVLFEEAGGDRTRAAFHTIGVGPVCVSGAEMGYDVTLSCGEHGRVVTGVDVASFGVTRGRCGTYEGGCESKAALKAFAAACIGKESCTVKHTGASAGAGCQSGALTVQVTC